MSDNICIFCHGILDENGECSRCGFPQTSRAKHLVGTLEYGTRLGGYTVGDVVAMDGESTSYLSYDIKNNRRVIIKEFLPVSMIGGRDGDMILPQRGKEVLFKNLMMDFVDIHSAVAKANSRSVQAVYDIITENGTAYAVLEYIKGETLKENLIKRGKPYSFREARWLFKDLFNAVEILEEMNIAHGGISDETVMITLEGALVLTGFAIRDLRVRNEHIMYKLYDGFSAPEQYAQNKFAGMYTDIYSVGALFFNAVTGKLFYPGAFNDENIAALFPKHAIEAIKNATKTEPSERTDNISDFADGLDGKIKAAKAVPRREVGEKISKVKSFTESFDKRYIPIVAVVLIAILFVIAIFGMTGDKETTSYTGDSTSEVIRTVETVIVPDFRNVEYEKVIENPTYTEDFQFSVSYIHSNDVAEGHIVSHTPEVGTKVGKGTVIYLTVSKGGELPKVPDGLVGMDIARAESYLDSLGIRYAQIQVKQTEKYPYNTVAGTDKVAGTEIDPDRDVLLLYVSDNTPLVVSSSSASREEPPQSSEEPQPPRSSREQTPSESIETENSAENTDGNGE